MQTTLSIAIPTYNRVKFLQTTVECFAAQIKAGGFENQVEILIGDDASSDGTREYLKQVSDQHAFVRAYSNPDNLGVSGNVEKLIDESRGEYVWGFGEDDLITDQSLEKVLSSIAEDDPNIIILNTINTTSLDDRNREYKIWDKDRLDIDNDIFIDLFNEEKGKLSAVDGWLYMSNLISSVVFRRELFLAHLPEAKKYVRPENVYLFQAPLLIGLAKQGRLKLLADRIVLHRKNENHWSAKTSGLVRINLYDASEAVELVRKFLPSEYKDYQKIFAVHTFNAIKRGKRRGERVSGYAWDAIKKYYSCFPYSIRFFIALFVPKSIFQRLTQP